MISIKKVIVIATLLIIFFINGVNQKVYGADSQNKVINLSNSISLEGKISTEKLNTLTVEAIVNPAELMEYAPVVSVIGVDENNEQSHIIMSLVNNKPAVFLEKSHIYTMLTSEVPLNVDEYVHISIVVNEHTIKIYINGDLVYSTKGFTFILSQPKILIGSGYNNKYFKGQLDEIRIFASERSQEDIKKNVFSSISNQKINSLVGYWSFENSSNDSNLVSSTRLNDVITMGEYSSLKSFIVGDYNNFIFLADQELRNKEYTSIKQLKKYIELASQEIINKSNTLNKEQLITSVNTIVNSPNVSINIKNQSLDSVVPLFSNMASKEAERVLKETSKLLNKVSDHHKMKDLQEKSINILLNQSNNLVKKNKLNDAIKVNQNIISNSPIPSSYKKKAENNIKTIKAQIQQNEAKKKKAAEEAAKKKKAAEEAAKKEKAAEEAAKKKKAAAEAERKKKAAAEAERKKKAAAEAERKKKAAAEAERKKKAAVEAERKKKAAAEAERKKKAAAEAERKKKAAAEEERKKKAAAEAERKKKAAAEAAKKKKTKKVKVKIPVRTKK